MSGVSISGGDAPSPGSSAPEFPLSEEPFSPEFSSPGLSSSELSDPMEVARVLGYGSVAQTEDYFVAPRGYRQLAQVPRLPRKVSENLIRAFGSLESLLHATEHELELPVATWYRSPTPPVPYVPWSLATTAN